MKMKPVIRKILLIYLCLFVPSTASQALQWQRGDIITAEAPFESLDPGVMRIQNKIRAMNEALLMMQVPQYQFGGRIVDQQIVRSNFIYHVEILPFAWTFEDCGGYTWHRYKFTDFAMSLLDPGHAGDVYRWIVDRPERYRIPFDQVEDCYRDYINGYVRLGDIPLVMIGTKYGQTTSDYTDFANFYTGFMNKHHFCVTASNWAIYKAIYDKTPCVRGVYDQSLSDPQVVQAFDTLTGGRLIGFLLDIGFIEEY